MEINHREYSALKQRLMKYAHLEGDKDDLKIQFITPIVVNSD